MMTKNNVIRRARAIGFKTTKTGNNVVLSAGNASIKIGANEAVESVINRIREMAEKFAYTPAGEMSGELYFSVIK